MILILLAYRPIYIDFMVFSRKRVMDVILFTVYVKPVSVVKLYLILKT